MVVRPWWEHRGTTRHRATHRYRSAMGLGDEKYIRFTTFRRSGTPVATAVWVVRLDGGELAFSTGADSGKAKRLAHTSRVLVQPCDSRGRAKAGSMEIEASARMATPGEVAEIERKVRAKYGLMVPLIRTVYKVRDLVRPGQRTNDGGVVITLPS